MLRVWLFQEKYVKIQIHSQITYICCFLGFFFGDASGKLLEIIDVLMVGADKISEESTAGIIACLIALVEDTIKDGSAFVLKSVATGVVAADGEWLLTPAVILWIEWLIGFIPSMFSLKRMLGKFLLKKRR